MREFEKIKKQKEEEQKKQVKGFKNRVWVFN